MSRLIGSLVGLLLLGLSVFAQEAVPQLPDFTNWELTGWDIGSVLYKGKTTYILDEHYGDRDSKKMIMVYYKPTSREVYEKLREVYKKLDLLTPDEQDKQVHALAGKTPLFLYYDKDSENDYYVYLYGKDVRWFEFYRLWKPRWKFLIKYTPANSEEAMKLIWQKYKIRLES